MQFPFPGNGEFLTYHLAFVYSIVMAIIVALKCVYVGLRDGSVCKVPAVQA